MSDTAESHGVTNDVTIDVTHTEYSEKFGECSRLDPTDPTDPTGRTNRPSSLGYEFHPTSRNAPREPATVDQGPFPVAAASPLTTTVRHASLRVTS